MPEETPPPRLRERKMEAAAPAPALAADSAQALRPLRRLRQLASEIQAALECNDLGVVIVAADLLPFVLADWQETQAGLSLEAGEAAQVALETHRLLTRCEAILTEAMRQVAEELRRLQRGKRSLAILRERHAGAAKGRRIDTRR